MSLATQFNANRWHGHSHSPLFMSVVFWSWFQTGSTRVPNNVCKYRYYNAEMRIRYFHSLLLVMKSENPSTRLLDREKVLEHSLYGSQIYVVHIPTWM